MWRPEARLAHAIPIDHSTEAEPAITLALLTLGVLAAVGAGLWLGRAALDDARWRQASSALALGALLFLLFDLLKETASLGQGVVDKPLLQAALLAAFVGGLVGLAASAQRASGARLAWAWALLGVGAHGAGEAWIVGTEAYSAAIAAPTQASSFLLHKLLEGFSVLLVASLALPPRALAGIAGAVAALALAGGLAGFLLGPGTAPLALFAVGAGATAFAVVLLARRVPPTLANAGWIALGVVAIYAAGLLHQY